jgi:hypothetical protein
MQAKPDWFHKVKENVAEKGREIVGRLFQTNDLDETFNIYCFKIGKLSNG